MNCLIVEDEKVAAERLSGLIKKCDPFNRYYRSRTNG